jgi:hypothetical protein
MNVYGGVSVLLCRVYRLSSSLDCKQGKLPPWAGDGNAQASVSLEQELDRHGEPVGGGGAAFSEKGPWHKFMNSKHNKITV